MAVLTLQRRMMELGRVRLGEKGAKGEPRKLSAFRFTSASKVLLDAIAAKHGGTVRPWEGAPEEGYFEVKTKAVALDIILPPVYSDVDGRPTVPYSQFFEMWSGGGCQRRCDGITEALSGKPCLCTDEARPCKITTRVSFMLPDIPGLGVWRLESHGMNAAVELPTTLEVLVAAAKEHRFIPAVLTIQHRSKKIPGEGTRRFIVPAITLPNVTVQQIADGTAPLALNAPAPAPPRPELPPAEPLPAEAALEVVEEGEWGTAPELPNTVTYAEKLANLIGELDEAGRPPGQFANGDWQTVADAYAEREFGHGLAALTEEEFKLTIGALAKYLETLKANGATQQEAMA